MIKRSNSKKIFSVFTLIVVAFSGLVLANYAMNKYFAFKSHAGIGNANLFFEPSATTITSTRANNLNLWATVDQGVSQIEITYTFDPRLVYLASDIVFEPSPFILRANTPDLQTINRTGRGSIILAIKPNNTGVVKGTALEMAPPPYPTNIPSPSPTPTPPPKESIAPTPTPTPKPSLGPVPTDIPVLPIGTIKLATIPLRAYKPTRTSSVFSLDLKATKIIGGDSVAFALSSEPAMLYLNSPVPPSPSIKATPKSSFIPSPSPTPTPPPGTCLSPVMSVAYANQNGACPEGQAQSASYVCKDNYSGSLGDYQTCTSFANFDALAQSRCNSPHSCVNTPLPSASVKPTPTTSTTSYCPQKLATWRYRELCSIKPESYRYVEYQCATDKSFITIGDSYSCKDSATWYAEATRACAARACASVTPTPTPTPSSTTIPISTSSCKINCYLKYWNQTDRVACLQTCF